jgi:hypothetical protein
VEFHARNAENPSLEEVIDGSTALTWRTPHGTGPTAEIHRVVDGVVLYDLMRLSANEGASAQVRAIAALKLEKLKDWLSATKPGIRDDEDEQAHISWGIAQIEQFEKDPKKVDLTPPAEPPDGPPIGADEDWDFWQ